MRRWAGIDRPMLRTSVFALSSEPVTSGDKAAAVDLIPRCLQRRPSDRIDSMEQVLQHRFFGQGNQSMNRVLVVSCPEFGFSPDTGKFNFPVCLICLMCYLFCPFTAFFQLQVMDRMSVLNQETGIKPRVEVHLVRLSGLTQHASFPP